MALDKFQHDNKIYYREDYIVMRNHLKNHHMNTNMQKGAMHIIDNLPDNVKIFLFGSVNKTPKTFNKLKSIILNKEIIIEQSTDSKEPKKTDKKMEYIEFDFMGKDDTQIIEVKFTAEEWDRFINKFSKKFAIRCVRRLELWYGGKTKKHYGNDSKKMYSWVIDAVRDDIAKDVKKPKRVQL